MIISIQFIKFSNKKTRVQRKKKVYAFKSASDYSKDTADGLTKMIIWMKSADPQSAIKKYRKPHIQLAQITAVDDNATWEKKNPDRSINNLALLDSMWPAPKCTQRFDFKHNGKLNFPTVEDALKDIDTDYHRAFKQGEDDVKAHQKDNQ